MATPQHSPHGTHGGDGHDNDRLARTPDTAQISNVDVAHEDKDVNISAIVKFALGMVAGVAVTFALMYAALRVLEAEPRPVQGRAMSRQARSGEERLPPHPRLQNALGQRFPAQDFTEDTLIQRELASEDLNFELEAPERYWDVLRGVKKKELSTYGALQRNAAEFRIPIDEAKRKLIEGNLLKFRDPPPEQKNLRPGGYGTRPTFMSSGRDEDEVNP